MLDRTIATALYIQLADDIREQIQFGSLRPGDKLPSEAQMIASYGVGRLTVRGALQLLVDSGYLEKAQGKGTFVKRSIAQPGNNIEVILDMENGYFISYFVRGISEILQANNCHFIISNTGYNAEAICNQLAQLLQETPAGIILELSSAHIPPDLAKRLKSLLAAFRQRRIPVLTIDSRLPDANVSYSALDEQAGGERAAEHLSAYGHKRCAILWNLLHQDSVGRCEGFCRAAEKFGMERPIQIDTGDSMEAELVKLVREQGVTGVFCYNDQLALRCIPRLKANGISVPDDVSIIGFDDSYLAESCEPPLTTISHPKEEMGRHAASAMVQLIRKEIPWPYHEVFVPRLIERGSCARCRPGKER